MTIKQSLEATTGLPVSRLKYSGTAQTYITFFEYDEDVENSSDDEIETIGHYVQVDLWTETDFTNYKSLIKLAMKNASFYFTNAEELYEDDTKVYHWASRYVQEEHITNEEVTSL